MGNAKSSTTDAADGGTKATEQEERVLYDQLHPTPGISSLRAPKSTPSGRHGFVDTSDDDDDDADEAPVGVRRTPPRPNQENMPPPNRLDSAHVHRMTTPDATMDIAVEEDPLHCGSLSGPVSPASAYYTPPSCHQTLRQARGAARATAPARGGHITPPNR